MPSTALDIQALKKLYGDKEVVCGISLSIPAGKCIGILGPNGAGKSTTMQMCFGVTKPSSGRINLLGHDIPQNALAARRRVGIVPQQNSLDPDFSCLENLSIYARYFGLAPTANELHRLLDFAGLATRANDRILTLSGGMQRRLTLARALVNDPDFIFLDEPTTGLDPQARHLLWERLRRLRSENRKTLLLTTHFMEEAERLCDRVYIMDHGRIIADGNPAMLVQTQVERDVVEIYGENAAEWLREKKHLYTRRESFGLLNYCYADDAKPLLLALQNKSFHFVHRNTNLEDVFLVVTGRDLRE